MRALVTGGAGFIGSHIADALLARGDEVVILDDISTGRRENIAGALAAGARLVEADVRDAEAMERIAREVQPLAIFHLAAQIDVRRSVLDPIWDSRVNVEGTVNLLRAGLAAGAERFVFSSTGGGMYGEADVLPTPEDAAAIPLSPYGQSKYAADGYCRLFGRLYGLSTICLRYGNVYGPRQDPHGEAGVIAIFCGLALEGGSPRIYGDGKQTRDYVYVDDVVAANLAAADGAAIGAFNVGHARETSLLDLVEALRPHATGPWDPSFLPARPGEVLRSCLDGTRAREELGWETSVDLDEGLRRTLEAARAETPRLG
jgi:UDP-glucose 4-epimerase